MNTENNNIMLEKIAYFVNQHPMVSHSFVRREIHALEKLGYPVERYALKTAENELVDPLDKSELQKTRYILQQKTHQIILAVLSLLVKQPLKFLDAFVFTCKIGWRSDRGLFIYLVYFIEACALTKWLVENKIKHVHAHFGTNSTTVVMLSRRLGGPQYSFTVHGPEEFDKPQAISLGEKVKNSAFVIAISSYGRSQIYRWCEHKYWEKVKVVHCGLDSGFYECEIPEVETSNNIVCIGRLCEQKGQLLLVEAVSQLLNEGTDVNLVLAGDGPMRKEIEELVQKNNIGNHVRITGWISSDQVREELFRARALVLPSFAEGLPVVIMESMALKRPVLSTYVAGIPELVIPGENGFLVTAGSTVSLKQAIMQLLSLSKTELREYGNKARKRVLERHNVDTEAAKLAEYISNALQKKHENIQI